ncbi:MAG: NAD(+) synthase, partial [Lentisphaeraceae bacterium]|nr:NAD(+) synthase [Lentisphaeraceae bacterium]
MKKIKVATGTLNQTPMDWQGNKQRIEDVIQSAIDAKVNILALPELCLSAYGCEDMFLSPAIADTALSFLMEIVPKCQGLVVTIGLPVFVDNSLYNAIALVVDGELQGFVPKQNLAGDGIHYEPRWFKAWPAGQLYHLNVKGKDYPFGDFLLNVNGVKIGIEICEDAWAISRPAVSLVARGTDVIINPSASHFAFGKQAVRNQLVMESARAFNVVYLYANLLGNESGRAIYDGERLIASGGKLIASGTRFLYTETALTTAIVDLDLNRLNQAQSYSRLAQHGEGVIDYAGNLTLTVDGPLTKTKHFATQSKEEEFTRAIALGLFDYMRKSFSRGFVVSLSGGADSAAVVILVDAMVKFGVAELGLDGFAQKANLKQRPANLAELQKALLTCVYQASENSSETTLNAAQGLAEELNAEFHNWQITTLVDGYTDMVETSLKRDLNWQQDDIALQNIQARVRAPGVWMMANIKGALLLATSNRSEAAVGYATMDGDTCGGLSPIAGIDKQFLLHWLNWMEEQRFDEIPAISALKAINVQKPTAELRPQEEEQTDEDDLMPYEALDLIEGLAIRDKMMPKDILEILTDEFQRIDQGTLKMWVER